MLKKIAYSGAVMAYILPVLSFAAEYSTTTATTDFANFRSDLGVLIGLGVAASVVGGAALMGLGFAWRHLKKYVSGRKF